MHRSDAVHERRAFVCTNLCIFVNGHARRPWISFVCSCSVVAKWPAVMENWFMKSKKKKYIKCMTKLDLSHSYTRIAYIYAHICGWNVLSMCLLRTHTTVLWKIESQTAWWSNYRMLLAALVSHRRIHFYTPYTHMWYDEDRALVLVVLKNMAQQVAAFLVREMEWIISSMRQQVEHVLHNTTGECKCSL